MILITGATGFVGHAVVERLCTDDPLQPVSVAVRRETGGWPTAVVEHVVGDLTVETSWDDAVQDVDQLIHCAARVHVMKDNIADPLAEFRRINVEGTLNLARQAAMAGVRRFLFLSSIKVNGESTLGHPKAPKIFDRKVNHPTD